MIVFFNEVAVLKRLDQLEKKIMTQFDDLEGLLSALRADAQAISTKMQSLIDQLNAGGLSNPEAAQIGSELAALKDSLDTLAAPPATT